MVISFILSGWPLISLSYLWRIKACFYFFLDTNDVAALSVSWLVSQFPNKYYIEEQAEHQSSKPK